MVRILAENQLRKLASKLPPRLGVRWPSTSGRDDEEGEHRARDKGDAGRIAVVGGSEEYTGSPYFAAMTALRCGACLLSSSSRTSDQRILAGSDGASVRLDSRTAG